MTRHIFCYSMVTSYEKDTFSKCKWVTAKKWYIWPSITILTQPTQMKFKQKLLPDEELIWSNISGHRTFD